jgi:NTP pyrophosphatase (non-canonical NTP hydrolase)
MNTIDYNMQDYMEDIYNFNELSGQADKLDKVNIENQIKLIEEEVKELRDAFTENDAVEVVDAVADILFVVIGLQQKLELLGCDMSLAYSIVAANNESKFPDNPQEAELTLDHYKEKGIECKVEFNNKYGRFIIKDENNKVRKPIYFKPCNLTDTVPAGIQINGD